MNYFRGTSPCSSFPTSIRRFSKLNAGNTIFLQSKVFFRKIKEITLVMYLIKINVHSSFKQLRTISKTLLNFKRENMLQRLTVFAASDLNLLAHTTPILLQLSPVLIQLV